MNELHTSLVELIRRTSAEIPDDVQRAILQSLEREKKGTIAESTLKIIERNIELAKQKSQPICQDTGSIIFFVTCPVGYDQISSVEQGESEKQVILNFSTFTFEMLDEEEATHRRTDGEDPVRGEPVARRCVSLRWNR